MKTIITVDANNNTSWFATNANNQAFELRFWQQVAKLQETNRWLVLVMPDQMIRRDLLKQAGICQNRTLIVHCQTTAQAINASEKALLNGKSSAVISWFDQLSENNRNRLTQASKTGNACSVMVKPTSPESVKQAA